MKPSWKLLSFAILAGSGVYAHPGESLAAELAERGEWLSMRRRDVASCQKQLDRRGILAAGVERRKALVQNLHRKRDLQDYQFSHATDFVYPPSPKDERLIFPDNSNCVLTPEVDGLGHFIPGEQIRSDIRENQPGVPLTLEIQLVDTHNCQPIPGIFLEVYQCNATGVYSGVQAEGNGNVNDFSNLQATFGRGIQQTDENGVVTFETIFPGHYFGVTSHIHILSHSSAQPVAPSGDGRNFVQATHNGRIFFQQDLISAVESTSPYNSNQQPLTLNVDDPVLNQEAAVTDPFARYTWLGERPEDGVLAWISVGIDPTVVHPMEYVGNGAGGNGGAL
ncbi:Putative intradiol ring-cleavage dioxygenase [Septoria linicola]|uniref:Intradiol ring-cleavage dioxygenase n=1 Tax=Septoria linicola TaxID=215465 RepID=A0A9Q9ER29_9PEZI|nr:putative intradiol ring-cleavage dioxygenase [Septoria linicola]USW59462.1 Putative intradiol ring-cleavage dioxygenase [Septoria linicola]